MNPYKKSCVKCNKEFNRTTLNKYGGSLCGKCSKLKCKCKVCDVEKTAKLMWNVNEELVCNICYIPTAFSYLFYPFLIAYLFTFSWFVGFLVLVVASLMFTIWMGQDTNGAIYHFKKIHNDILGPTSIRNSSKFVVLLTIILCIILIWTLVSPWFVYTVTHDSIYDSYTGNWDDVGTVGSQDAFTYEYYLGYGHVKQGNFYYESTAKTKYLQHSENLNYPWFSNTNNVDFWIDYGEYEELKHRDYVSSVTLALGLVSLTSYILAIITGFIFYRMTTELEPNSLNFRNKENFQLKIKSFAKKMTLLKKKKIIISSLEPYLNQLEKIYASKDAEEAVIKNPLTRLYLMNLFIIIGILFSLVATWYYSQNWYEAGIDDGLNGNIEADSSWIMTSAAAYNFYGNWHLSPMITLLHFSSLMGVILTFSHTIFLKRSCYNMITEIIDGGAKTNDFKIPSELLNDIEETLPIEEEDPLAPVELPDPGEGLLLDEVVESEEESVDDEN